MSSTDHVVSKPCAACNGSGVRENDGTDLERGLYEPCPSCRGNGYETEVPPRARDASGIVFAVAMVLIAIVAVVIIVHV